MEVTAKEKIFQCKTCKHGRHCDESNPAPRPIWNLPELDNKYICPLPMVPLWAFDLIRFYGHYKSNILPFGGGLLDQPAVFIQAMEIIEERFAKIREEKNG